MELEMTASGGLAPAVSGTLLELASRGGTEMIGIRFYSISANSLTEFRNRIFVPTGYVPVPSTSTQYSGGGRSCRSADLGSSTRLKHLDEA